MLDNDLANSKNPFYRTILHYACLADTVSTELCKSYVKNSTKVNIVWR